jgi:hypothetical protein
MKNRHALTGLLLALAVAMGVAPLPATADGDSDQQRPIRLYASARFGPVGSLNCDLAVTGRSKAIVINGRVAAGEQTIWGGELIQVPYGSSARVSFDSIGDVTLSNGARARFSTSISGSASGARNVLVASLVSGDLSVSLEPGAGAYVEAAGSAFKSSGGASFRVAVTSEGRPVVETLSGEVSTEAQGAQQRFTLRPPPGQGGALSVAARSTRQVQIQVVDENGRPVPDLPVLFSLGDPCLGTLGLGAGAGNTSSERTDSRGIATVPWVTGAARCASTIIARVEGTDSTYTYRVEVRPQGFWSMQNKLLVGAGAAAAGAGIAVVATRDNGEPIRPVPPPQVRP